MIETIITAILGVIAGNVSMFVFFRLERKAKILDNTAKEQDNEIDTLYEQISEWRDKYNNLASEKAQLEINNAKMCLLKCEVPSCPNRKPSTGY